MPRRKLKKGATRATIFRSVAQQRLEDANILLYEGRYSGAVYLAGYAVECQLKYAVCKRQNVVHLPPDLEVHAWDALVNAAGLLPAVQKQQWVFSVYSELSEIWGPQLRYGSDAYTPKRARYLYSNISLLYLFFAELVP